MKVKELIEIEEKWLLYQDKHKFEIPFNQYLLLLKKLKEIGEITHQYFMLMTEYDAYLDTQNLSFEDKKNKLEEYNTILLTSDVEFSFPKLDISKLK